MIPNYLMVARLGWLNTLTGLIIPQLGSTIDPDPIVANLNLREAYQPGGASDLQKRVRYRLKSLVRGADHHINHHMW